MHPVLLYIIKLSISLSVVFCFYQLLLRRLTFYNWNRFYLLGYTAICFLVPLINIEPVLQKNNWNGEALEWLPVIDNQAKMVHSSASNLLTINNIVIGILLGGVVIMCVRLLIQYISFRRLLQRAIHISGTDIKLYQVNEDIIPFSFGKSVFINQQLHTEQELKEIIRHEFVHIRQKHSMDIFWGELLCVINWFNPFAWLLKKAIRQNLEFIADNKVLENGVDRKEYQYLLLKVTGNNQFSIAASFNFSSLKKRIAMMNKLQSAKINLLRFIFILPLLLVILVSFRKQILPIKKSEVSLSGFASNQLRDSLPLLRTLNKNGYAISIVDKNGECEVVIRDKKNNEVKRMLLTEWNKNESDNEKLYGKIPPPPPPPPPAPKAPGAIAPPPPPPPAAHQSHSQHTAPAAPHPPSTPHKATAPHSVPAPHSAPEPHSASAPHTTTKKGESWITVRSGDKEKTISSTTLNTAKQDLSKVLFIVDGKKTEGTSINDIPPTEIESIRVLKGTQAVDLYGEEGKNGVIMIETKNGVRDPKAPKIGTDLLLTKKNDPGC